MRWFILVFLTLFALMHLYAYSRVFKPALGKRGRWVIALLLSFGFFSPFIWRYADANMNSHIAYITALGGLIWMGFLVYLVVLGLTLDLYKGVVYISKKVFKINPLPVPPTKATTITILLLSITLSAYSYYETLNLKVERYTLYTDKLPENVQRLKVPTYRIYILVL